MGIVQIVLKKYNRLLTRHLKRFFFKKKMVGKSGKAREKMKIGKICCTFLWFNQVLSVIDWKVIGPAWCFYSENVDLTRRNMKMVKPCQYTRENYFEFHKINL